MPKKKPFSAWVIVCHTGKKGRGVFAARAFRKGEVILPIKGRIITSDEAEKCSRYAQDHMYTLGRNKYMVARYPDKYINHSCSPNVYEKNRKIIAMKGIGKGKEISFHYAMNVLDDFTMKCHCKAKGCRGKIRGSFLRLPKREQKKLAPYLDDWFKKEFRKELKGILS